MWTKRGRDMTAARLIVARNTDVLSDRYDVAEAAGKLEWLVAILDEKRFLLELLRELALERRSVVPVSEFRAALYLALGAIRAGDPWTAEMALLELLGSDD